MTKCTAAVARGAGQPFTLEELTIDGPRAGEVLVKIAGVGLCHTDLVFREGGQSGYPIVLGHEGAGTVAALGEGVSGLAVGDAVIVGFSSCGHCPRCAEDLPSYCQSFSALNYAGMRLEDGSTAYHQGADAVHSHFFGQSTFSTLAVARARNLVKVDTHAPLEILGPLACGFQTGAGAIMRSLACPAGSSLVVFGGGPVGLAAIMASKIQRCATTILVEPMAERRQIGRELGATHTIDPKSVGDLAAAIREIAPDGVDFAFDTTGVVAVVEAGLAALGSHGALGLVGVPSDPDAALSVNIVGLMGPGHRIIGIIEGDSDQQSFIPELLAHHAAGRFPFDRLIRKYPLAEINEAIAAQARGECIKVVLVP